MRCIACSVKLWACLAASIARGHYIWLNEDLQGNAVVTFGEVAGEPGPWLFLSMIKGKASLSSHDCNGQHDISLSGENESDSRSKLIGHVNAVPPFSLRLACTFGIFGKGSLLQYWSSADMVTKPNDWLLVQDWAPRAGLEITLRDPWMKSPNQMHVDNAMMKQLELMDLDDECKPHMGLMQHFYACVVAVIRFNGELCGDGLKVESFTAEGVKLNTTQSQSGITILKIPYDATKPFTAVWARVNYHENVPGNYNGTNYTFVDHWATTYARIVRAPRKTHAFLVV